WRREQAVTISESDRQEILGLGEDLPRLWNATTTTSADRKQIIRLVVKEVTLDQKRRRGYVWIRIVWQTGSTSEHWLHRTVHSYAQHADQDGLRQRIIELNGQQKMDGEIADILNYSATVRMCGERQQGCPVAACVEDGVTGASRQGSRWDVTRTKR
ncbi:MAG TPA: hypothetical protein VK822_24620, partial [Acetobacteraceae bacterium]|nr:hypothetical protein [Acetobacteraceae bacterium]